MKKILFSGLVIFMLSVQCFAQIEFEYFGYVYCDTLEYICKDGRNWDQLLKDKLKGKIDVEFKKKDKSKNRYGWLPEKLILPAGFYYMAMVDGYPSFFDSKGKYIEPKMHCVKYDSKNKTGEKLKNEPHRYSYFRPSDDTIKDAEKLMKDYIKEKMK